MNLTARLAALLTGLPLVVGCASVQRPHAEALAEARPRSIVVLPVASADAKAVDYVLSLLPIPLAERGYYVFPVALVRRVLRDEGLGDTADPLHVATILGADAVLYVSVVRWDTVYGQTTDTVELSYVLTCGKTGALLWLDGEQRTHEWSEESAGFLEQLVHAIVDPLLAPLLADHERLAREANDAVLASPARGLPEGPYRQPRPPSPRPEEAPSTPIVAAPEERIAR